MKKISVIIPVFNSIKFLDDLFSCLDQCNFIDGDEVLLVDNGSTDGSREICMKKAEDPLYHALSFTDKADSYAARNYALGHASGDILVFTDSDCKPTAKWIEEIRNHIKPGEVIAGNIELEIVENNLWEHFDSITHLGQSQRRIAEGLVATANMAVHRTDFDQVGKFEERFSGGDFDWSKRAGAKGLKVRYLPDALVYHPSRKSFEEILRKEKRIAYGTGKSYKNNGKSLLKLIVIHILKFLKLSTNIRITRQLRHRGVSFKDQICFNGRFFQIRWEQLVAAVRGYKQINARSLGIK